VPIIPPAHCHLLVASRINDGFFLSYKYIPLLEFRPLSFPCFAIRSSQFDTPGPVFSSLFFFFLNFNIYSVAETVSWSFRFITPQFMSFPSFLEFEERRAPLHSIPCARFLGKVPRFPVSKHSFNGMLGELSFSFVVISLRRMAAVGHTLL